MFRAFSILAAALALSVAMTAAQKPAARGPASHYIGPDTCKTCHYNVSKPFESSPHSITNSDKRGAAFQGCEACHGPASEHVDSAGAPGTITGFAKLSAVKVTEICLGCHQYTEEHGNFKRSAHKISKVACTECHSVHHAGEKPFLLIKAQPQLCYRCHAETKAAFLKPFHHRVEEG